MFLYWCQIGISEEILELILPIFIILSIIKIIKNEYSSVRIMLNLWYFGIYVDLIAIPIYNQLKIWNFSSKNSENTQASWQIETDSNSDTQWALNHNNTINGFDALTGLL